MPVVPRLRDCFVHGGAQTREAAQVPLFFLPAAPSQKDAWLVWSVWSGCPRSSQRRTEQDGTWRVERYLDWSCLAAASVLPTALLPPVVVTSFPKTPFASASQIHRPLPPVKLCRRLTTQGAGLQTPPGMFLHHPTGCVCRAPPVTPSSLPVCLLSGGLAPKPRPLQV